LRDVTSLCDFVAAVEAGAARIFKANTASRPTPRP
jgi:hypothetical protein